MKKNYLISLLAICSFFLADAQENFSIEKIDNTDFPYIRVYVRAKKTLHVKDFIFSEGSRKLVFNCDTIEGENLGNGANSILFVIREDAKEEIADALIKQIKHFSKQDKMNLAIILNDTSENIIHYLSPEFSGNYEFFINALKQKTFKDIVYKINSKIKKDIVSLEKKINMNQDIYSNKAILFVVNNIRNKAESFSKILNQKEVPIYILQTEDTDSISKKNLADICSKSGGIYSFSDKESLEKTLKLYIKKISRDKNKLKPNMLRFIFETKQTQKKNFFKVRYGDETKQYSFSKPQKDILAYWKQVLFFILGAIFMLAVFFVFRKNKNVSSKKTKGIAPVSVLPMKTIEINVKTKGFNKTYFFEKHIIRIGRSEDNDIVIPDRTVSTFHTLINREGDKFLLQDLGSTNGVYLNQKKIKKQSLKTNDKIKLGAAILIVRV